MKKRKTIRNVSLVALSAVMVCGAAAAFAGCSNDTYTLTVSIFCNRSDEYTNTTICEQWEKEYSEKLGTEVHVELSVNPEKNDYFQKIGEAFGNGSAADVVYLSPKYVKQWAEVGRVMDLSPYILQDSLLNTKEETATALQGIWQNGLSYYGYRKGESTTYVPGQAIKYDSATGKLVAESDNQAVELYGLPKDYSNFAMGYNKKFFTSDLKKAYTTTKTSAVRNVLAGDQTDKYYTKGLTHTGTTDTPSVTYAVSGDYTNPYTGQTMTATAGQEAPLINIGVPTTYKPFNFYRFKSYDDALAAGDPMAKATSILTRNQGYTVTIPGFPGETFAIDDATNAKNNATDVPYDVDTGHIVFTYAEFGALTWAVTYYLNTFDWDAANPLAGQGGVSSKVRQMNVYGNDMYEGAQGNPLYLLTWLSSNDADFINESSTKAMNGTTAPDLTSTARSSDLAGTNSQKVKKLNLDGTYREADVQYGVDSKNFIETYGAYHEYGSTWNGNAANSGDTTENRSTGWELYRMGCSVFYGAGTWDAATRNESEQTYFEFGEMPAPVAEKYALYSTVKNADYEMQTYSNGATTKGTGNTANNDGAQRSNLEEGKTIYNAAAIKANQILRQDKWAARMDSVGYAANARLLSTAGTDEGWKIEGAASLIMALTINKDAQKTLTYAGAQLPNFRDQCKDFLDYNKQTEGEFKEMITPEGFYNTTDPAEGKAIWDHYYDIAVRMADASRSSNNNITVGDWLAQNAKDYNGTDPARYDEQYKDVLLSEFTGEDTYYSFAMKVLRMVAFDRTDRDLNLRMQYGLNSVRDSSMYTFTDVWIDKINPATTGKLLAYINQVPFDANVQIGINGADLQNCPSGNKKYQTPATYLIRMASQVQAELDKAIQNERESISSANVGL